MTVLHIYAGESSTGKQHARMVYGGVVLTAPSVVALEATMDRWRQSKGMTKELKWTKVSTSHQDNYCFAGKKLLTLSQNGQAGFKSMVVRQKDIDYHTYHGNDKETGFYKLMYQFLLHSFCPFLSPSDRLIVRLDDRPKPWDLDKFGEILSSGIRAKTGFAPPTISVTSIDSKSSNIMQMVDIVIGATGWHNNDRQRLPGASPSKTHVANEIARHAELSNLKTQTPKRMERFGIWQFRFNEREKAS